MAHLIRDGFDFYATASDGLTGLWDALSVSSGAGVSATSRFGVGQSYELPGLLNGIGWAKAGFTNSSTIFLNFALGRYAAIGAAAEKQSIRITETSTVQCSIAFDNDGSMKFYRGDNTTLLGTYAGAFSGSAAGVWTHFQIKIVLSNTVGEFHVRKNGSSVDDYTLTAVDNCSNANEYMNKFDTKGLTSSSSAFWRFDDLWLFNSSVVAGEPSDWIGDVRAVQVMPSSDSSVMFTPLAGSNFSNVDELINSTADYVSSADVGDVDLYGNAGLSISPSSIKGLTVKMQCNKTDAGPRTVDLQIQSNGNTVNGPAVSIGTVNQPVVYNVDLNPDGSVPWTAGTIAALLFGPRIAT